MINTMMERTPIPVLKSTVCTSTASRILVLLLVIIYTTYTSTAISMCSTFSTSGRTVKLYRNNDDDINCYCIVKLAKLDPPATISFKQNTSTGCQYQIQFTHNNDTEMYRCDRRNETSLYIMNKQDEIQIQLVPGRDTTDGFTFRLEISTNTNGNSVDLRCYTPSQHTSSLTTIRQETTITNDPIIQQPTSNTTKISHAGITTNNTVIPQTDTDNPTDSNIPVIIGASVGGVVLMVVIIIFILIIRRIQTRKEKPQVVTGNQVHVETPIITDNDLYISYDTVTSPNNVTIISKTDNPIITENELYVSSDQARGYGSGNHGDTEHPADVYAVVQKTSKRQECNKTDEKQKSSFIIGPHGDEYSFVNKQ